MFNKQSLYLAHHNTKYTAMEHVVRATGKIKVLPFVCKASAKRAFAQSGEARAKSALTFKPSPARDSNVCPKKSYASFCDLIAMVRTLWAFWRTTGESAANWIPGPARVPKPCFREGLGILIHSFSSTSCVAVLAILTCLHVHCRANAHLERRTQLCTASRYTPVPIEDRTSRQAAPSTISDK